MELLRKLSAAGLLLLATFLYAQPTKLVLVTEVWPPYRMDDSSSPSGFSGIDIDVTLVLQERLGIPIQIKRTPWARALDMLRKGQADLISGIAWTAERAEYLRYVPTSYSAVHPMFFAPVGKGLTVQSYNDLRGKSIGMSTHSAYFEPFNSDSSLNKVPLSTEEQILQMLALSRIDLAIGTDPNLSWDIARLGHKGKVEPTAWQPPDTTPLYFAVSPLTEATMLVQKIDQILKEMLADGTMQKILNQYK
ncbi:MAG: transporter substrate-binding domain-containing protein [Spirochaetes bacterium]|nr:transporter substrate-binding domain-containing protein [Spirochaetota bacterium]